MLLAGEQAVTAQLPTPDDELLDAELSRLARRIDAVDAERRRLADVYQAGVVDAAELSRRAADIDRRQRELAERRDGLVAQRQQLTKDNQLRHRVQGFAERVLASIDDLDFPRRQRLVRLLVERVQVSGWQVDIHLRVPLDEPPPEPPPFEDPGPGPARTQPVSSEDRLRILCHGHCVAE